MRHHRFASLLLVAGIALSSLLPQQAEAADPVPTVPCHRNVPQPADGVQIWDPDPDPTDRIHTDGVVCVRILKDGRPVNGVPVNMRRSNAPRLLAGQSTTRDGVAAFIFFMRPGSVRVLVTTTYDNRAVSLEMDVQR